MSDQVIPDGAVGNLIAKGIAKGVGTDLLDQRRIAKLIEKQGERFSIRILTPKELLLWSEKGCSVNFLAKRFAAKEAISKALGTGIAKGVGFQQMNILSDSLGKPIVELSGEALIRAKVLGAEEVLLSLTDEGEMILAFAVLI